MILQEQIDGAMTHILDTSDCLEEAISRAEKMINVFPMLTKETVIEEITYLWNEYWSDYR